MIRSCLLFLAGLLTVSVLAAAQNAPLMTVRITCPDNATEASVAPSPAGVLFVSDDTLLAYKVCKSKNATLGPMGSGQAEAHFYRISAGIGPAKVATIAASTPFKVYLTPKGTLITQSGSKIEAFDTNFESLGRYDLGSKYTSVYFSPSGHTVLALEYLDLATRLTFLDGDTARVRSVSTTSNCRTDNSTVESFAARKRHIESISDTRVLFTVGGSEHFLISQQELCTGSKGQHVPTLSGMTSAIFVSEDLILADFLLDISVSSPGGRIHDVRNAALPKAKLIGYHARQNMGLLTWGEFRVSRHVWKDDDPVLKTVAIQLHDLSTFSERDVVDVDIDPKKPFVSALSPYGKRVAVLNGDLLSIVKIDSTLPKSLD